MSSILNPQLNHMGNIRKHTSWSYQNNFKTTLWEPIPFKRSRYIWLCTNMYFNDEVGNVLLNCPLSLTYNASTFAPFSILPLCHILQGRSSVSNSTKPELSFSGFKTPMHESFLLGCVCIWFCKKHSKSWAIQECHATFSLPAPYAFYCCKQLLTGYYHNPYLELTRAMEDRKTWAVSNGNQIRIIYWWKCQFFSGSIDIVVI